MPFLKSATLFIATALAATTVHAAVLWDTGGPMSAAGVCDAEGCLGSTEWELLGEFTASQAWNVTGFTFYSFDFDMDDLVGDYLSTRWRIATGTDSSLTTIFSGSAAASLSAVGDDFWAFEVSGLDIDLAAGSYWLGRHHDFSSEYQTTGALASMTGEFTQYQLDPESFSGTRSGTLAQSIHGVVLEDHGMEVPVPAPLLLLGLGLTAMSVMRRNSRSQ